MPTNALKQPIGEPVTNWQPIPPPPRTPMEGRYCRIEPIDVDRHGHDLFTAFSSDVEGRNWTYLPYGQDIPQKPLPFEPKSLS